MSGDDTRKPFPGRPGRGRDVGMPSYRPPPRPDARPGDEEDVGDEDTWAAAGSPYGYRENTAEVNFFEGDRTTNVDWNPGSGSTPSYDDDALSINMRPRAFPTPNDTPPDLGPTTGGGFGFEPRNRTPGPRSAGGPRSDGGVRDASSIPVPRARSADGVRPIPPVRRAGNLAEQSGTHRPPVPPATTRAVRPAPSSVVGVLVPVAIASVAMFGVAALVLSSFSPVDESAIVAPMLPVVGGPTPKVAPPPPFDLLPPEPFRPDLVDPNVEMGDLGGRVVEARAAENVALATALSDRLVRLDGRPQRFYPNGRLLADMREVDAAFYWLVRAVQEQGLPPNWLVEDRAFRFLWLDPRWDPFIRWAVLTTRFYSSRGSPLQQLAIPVLEDALVKDAARQNTTVEALKRRKEGPALPVLLWLDDIAGNGAGVPMWGEQVAQELGVIVIGIGGPERIGPSGGMWSSDPARDKAYLDAALAALPGVKADPTRRYLAGIGQGAQYAIELMLREPDFARAAIAFGPTDTWKGPRDAASEGKARQGGQSVQLAAGAFDAAQHTLVRLDRGRLMRANIVTDLRLDEIPWPDGQPPDLGKRLTTWLGEALGPKPPTPETTAAAVPALPKVETAPAPPGAPPPPAATP